MPLTVVLDTNILLVSISRKSRYHWLFEHLRNETYDLLVTTPIILEYQEILSAHMGHRIAARIVELLEEGPNVHQQRVYYRWDLIKADPDDNKFVDCAIAGGADYLITHDSHFNVLREIDFPQVSVITAAEFRELLEGAP